MGRILFVGGLVCMALGLVALPAVAEDDEGLRREVEKLRQEVQVMRTSMLEKDIDSYLAESDAWRGAQGGLQGVTINARFTSVFQGAFVDPADIGVMDGDVDLDMDFQVTDNLSLFIKMTANNASAGSFPIAGNNGPTLAGATDGIGVNGTVPTNPGSVTTYEAGIYHVLMVGDTKLHWEGGELDPRTRFLQNAFADDENTQFISNSFDDTSAVLWLTDATGRTSLGWHMWINFGDNQQFTVNWGYFNTPGQFFSRGQFYFQFSWKGEISGRESNIRVMAVINEFFRDATGDGDAAGGASWDWWATDKIGVFVRIAANGGDVNPIELDGSLGVVFQGLISSRPDDTLGIAFSFITTNDDVVVLPEDTEFSLEIYYRYMMEDGKLQVTPHLIYVNEPGGGTTIFGDDTLFILGLRIHVPF